MLNEGTKKNAGYFYKVGVFLFIFLLAVDQGSKKMVKQEFLNYKFAFSLNVPPVLIYVIYTFVVGAIIYYIAGHCKNFSKTAALAWILILAGAFSNIGERIVFGYVRDWIYIYNGIFNLADFYIIAGIILLLFQPSKK